MWSGKSISRRELLRAGAAASAAVTLGGRRLFAAAAKPRYHLRLGVYAFILQGPDFNGIVQRYVDQHPDVQITVEPIPGSMMADLPAVVQRFTLEARQGRASYDVLIGPNAWSETAALARTGAIVPVQDYVPKSVIEDLFEPVKQGETTETGQVWGFPWWTDVVGLLYRKSYLRQAAATSTPPRTWDELKEYAQRIKAFGRWEAYGGDWAYSHRLFLPIFVTLTDRPFDERGVWRTESPEFLEALRLLRELERYMPAAAQQDLGSGRVFQAGNLVLFSAWPTQILRAIQAGQPEADIGFAPNPRGRYSSTIFWTAGCVIPAAAQNKEEIGRFLVEGLLSEYAVEQTYKGGWRVLPYRSVTERFRDRLPWWAPTALDQLSTGHALPPNPYWLNVEQPVFKEEVERMILQGQSPEMTQQRITERIREGIARLG